MINRIKHRIRSLFRQKAVILMYHQIGTRMSDPWELAVSRENFEQHLSFLKKYFDVVTPEEIAGNVARRKISSRQVAITFDDGSIDNFTNAKPLLESYRLPATFYMATHAVESGEPFWWEELERIILRAPVLPGELTLAVGSVQVDFRFYSNRELTPKLTEEIRQWTAEKPITNERVSLFLQLWSLMQPVDFHRQKQIIRELKSWAGSEAETTSQHVMTLGELGQLSANKLFSIGAHSVHHAMLGTQDEKSQQMEVNESKQAIENWLGKMVSGFAYPYGNYNSVTKRLLRDHGFRYGVSTECRGVSYADDVFALPRVQVKNWNEKEFSHNIRQILAA